LAQTIAIVDYGMGNLRSVYQAFHHVAPDDNILIAHQPEEIATADRVVLPGQGAMPDCMKHLEESGLLERHRRSFAALRMTFKNIPR